MITKEEINKIMVTTKHRRHHDLQLLLTAELNLYVTSDVDESQKGNKNYALHLRDDLIEKMHRKFYGELRDLFDVLIADIDYTVTMTPEEQVGFQKIVQQIKEIIE